MDGVGGTTPSGGRAAPSRRRADIQGLRALAVILVVIYHAEVHALGGGYIGVDVFFVVSGFVITRLLVGEQRATGRIGLKDFYLRRARRILPALALLLVPVLLVSPILGSTGAESRALRTGAAAALFNANTFLALFGNGGYFNAAATANPFLHTWSLSLEEQFYFVFPALLVVAGLLVRRRRLNRTVTLAATVSIVALVSFVLCWASTTNRLPGSHLGIEFAFFMAPMRVWQFAAGALLAIVGHRWRPHRAVAEVCGWAGLAMIVVAAFAYDGTTLFPGFAAIPPTLGAFLIIAAGTNATSTTSRVLSLRPLGWIGDRSYSWYLWHWPLIVFTAAWWPADNGPKLLAAATLSIVPAWASHRWVEEPIRHRKPGLRPTLRLAAICIVVPLVAAGIGVAANRSFAGSSSVVAYDRAVGRHIDATTGCFQGRAVLPNPACRWEAPAVGRSTTGRMGNVMIGDSNAGQYSEAFIAASNRQGRDATIQTKGVCPFIDITIINDHVRRDDCRNFVTSMLDEVVRERPDAVMIATAADNYIEQPFFELIGPDGTVARSPEARAKVWAQGLASIVKTLRDADIDVVIAQPQPRFPGWDPHECATGRVLLDEGACGTSRARDDLEEHRARAVAAQRGVARSAGAGVTIIDPWDDVCPGDRCATRVDGTWWFRDGNHVSVAGGKRSTDRIAAAFESLG